MNKNMILEVQTSKEDTHRKQNFKRWFSQLTILNKKQWGKISLCSNLNDNILHILTESHILKLVTFPTLILIVDATIFPLYTK